MTEASWQIPLVTVNQGEDGFYPGSDVGTEEDVVRGRTEKLAPWSHFIALGCGHDSWCKMEWMSLWIEDIAALRIAKVIAPNGKQAPRPVDQSQGWLGRYSASVNFSAGLMQGSHWTVQSAEVWPFAKAQCQPKDCLWFPSQRTAEAWQYAMTHDGNVP